MTMTKFADAARVEDVVVGSKFVFANPLRAFELDAVSEPMDPGIDYGTCRYQQMCGVQIHRLRGGVPRGLLLRVGQSIGHSPGRLH